VKNSSAENFPQFGFGVPNAGYGMGPGNALNQWEQTLQYADAVTYLTGKHAFKFGGDLRLNQVNKACLPCSLLLWCLDRCCWYRNH
jgi:hypothetical protein